MNHLKFVRVYLDDLLIITNRSFDDHLAKLGQVLHLLKRVGLKCNLKKSFLCQEQVEYLGYLLTRDGIKPTPGKVKAILDLAPPTNVRGVRRVLGIIQYYCDLWNKRSHILAPLTSLVGECGKNKNSKIKAKSSFGSQCISSLRQNKVGFQLRSNACIPRLQQTVCAL